MTQCNKETTVAMRVFGQRAEAAVEAYKYTLTQRKGRAHPMMWIKCQLTAALGLIMEKIAILRSICVNKG